MSPVMKYKAVLVLRLLGAKFKNTIGIVVMFWTIGLV
jgi:hypothetical protein